MDATDVDDSGAMMDINDTASDRPSKLKHTPLSDSTYPKCSMGLVYSPTFV